jgi:hypothetical protein
MSPDTQLVVNASADGRSGTAEFENLAPVVENPADEFPEAMSGTLSWACE